MMIQLSKYVILLTFLISNAYAGPLMDKIKTGLNLAEVAIDIGNGVVDSINHEEVKNYIYFDGNTITESTREPSREEQKIAKEYWQLGNEKQKIKKHIEAVPKYRKSLEHNANDPQAWHAYGWSLSELNLYNKAITAFTMSLALGNKRSDETWRYLGWNYQRSNQLDKARECYLEALFKNPDNRKAKYALSSLSLKNQESTSTKNKAYIIQIGVYSYIENAKKRLAEIKNTYDDAEIRKIENKYCIVIGDFETRKEAMIKKSNLPTKESKGFYIKEI